MGGTGSGNENERGGKARCRARRASLSCLRFLGSPRNVEFDPLGGEELQRMIAQTLDVPPAVAARGIELSRE